MSKKALSDLLQRWVNRNRARLRLEEVENRVVPTTAPTPHSQSRPVIVL